MKVRINQERSARGSVLLIAMGFTFVLGLGLAGYLMLSSWHNAAVVRSQAWNSSMAMAEAGVEEALAQLNPSALLFMTNIDRSANGWALSADGMYHAARRTLPDGYYDVAITGDTNPIIYATGYVTIPTLSATVTRAVKVGTGNSGIYRGGMAARVNIDLNGNTLNADSFDSMDPLHSTNQLYYFPWRKAGCDVACTEGFINVQNANVAGTLYTGPQGGYVINANGTVGDLPWVTTTMGMEPGHYKNDFNMDFPPALPPFQSGFSPGSGTVNGTNYTYVLGYKEYMINGDYTLKNNETLYVSGVARLYVTGNFDMNNGSSIIIPNGSVLMLWVGGATTTISTMNNGGNCASFCYFGLPGNTSVTLGGNNVFLGSIYAPSAALVLNGGGNDNTLDYQGACAVNTIKMNGHFNFHFDENLRRNGPQRGYQVTSWQEI